MDAGGLAQDVAQQVNVVGSTNLAAGGSRYRFASSDPAGFHLAATHGVRFSHLSISGASNGLYVDDSFFIGGDWVTVQGAYNGLSVQGNSSNVDLTHVVLAGNQNAGVALDAPRFGSVNLASSVLWSNRYGIHQNNGFIRITNNVFGMVRPGSFAFYAIADAPQRGYQGDYNSMYVARSDAAVGALQLGVGFTARTSTYASVSAWAVASGRFQ